MALQHFDWPSRGLVFEGLPLTSEWGYANTVNLLSVSL